MLKLLLSAHLLLTGIYILGAENADLHQTNIKRLTVFHEQLLANTDLLQAKNKLLTAYREQLLTLTISEPVYERICNTVQSAKTIDELINLDPRKLPEQKDWKNALNYVRRLEVVASGRNDFPAVLDVPQKEFAEQKIQTEPKSRSVSPVDKHVLAQALAEALASVEKTPAIIHSAVSENLVNSAPFNSPPKS